MYPKSYWDFVLCAILAALAFTGLVWIANAIITIVTSPWFLVFATLSFAGFLSAGFLWLGFRRK